MTPIRRCGISIAAILVLALCGASPALGAIHLWIGPTNGTWSTAGNWIGGKPTSGESGGTIVEFDSSSTSTMDIAGLVVDQIDFTGAGNTINGSTPLTISGSVLVQNIVSEAAGNTLSSSLQIALTGASTLVSSSTGEVAIASPISGTPGMAFVGSGEFAMTGQNSYAGATTIVSGTLHIATPVGVVISGSSLKIGDGSEPAAKLVLDQSSDISPETPITVERDGVFDFKGESDSGKSLTVNDGQVLVGSLNLSGALTMSEGTVTIRGVLNVGSLTMTGGTIGAAATGPNLLVLSGNIGATSSASAPATVSTPVELKSSPTVTVTAGAAGAAGTAPELRLTGVISEFGGARSITKAGNGTLLTSAANTYTGTTTVSAGTLVANGTQAGAFSVGQTGTLTGSGALGATTVEGTLAPLAPGLTTGSLSFGPLGRLDETLTSLAPGTVPSAIAKGPVTIDPSAALNLIVAPGTALPHGSTALVIDNKGSEPIAGQFTGIPNGFVLPTSEGVPLAVSYAGAGNDMSLTAANVPPQAGSVAATPSQVAVGQPVALSVTASDANQDPLTTTWSFGDGTTGSGTSTSHIYTTAGVYTAVATVSDGLAQVQSTTTITVNATPPTGGGSVPLIGGSVAPTTAGPATVSAYGATFSLSAPSSCVKAGAPFTVTLKVKLPKKGKSKGSVKVTKVVFTIAGKTVKTLRSAPFAARLTIPRGAVSGSTIKVRAVVHLKLRGGKVKTKTITVGVRAC
jgi:fibronectin-binding autotransporter adhesin